MATDPLARLRNRPTPTATATLAYDPDDVDRLNAAQAEADRLAAAAKNANPQSTAAKNAAKAKRAADKLRREIVTVTFEAAPIGAAAVAALEAEHPPTDEQQAKAAEQEARLAASEGRPPRPVALDWNVDTYPPALIAASLTKITFSDDPDNPITDLDADTIADIYGGMTRLDQLELVGLCQAVNFRSSRVEPLGKD